MKRQHTRGRRFFANKMHREMFFIVFLASLVPTVMTVIGLFYLIFDITAEQVGIPEVIAYNIVPAAQRVTSILLIVMPIVGLAILTFAYQITHRMIGPFDRIVRELDEHVEGKRQGPLKIRKNDKFFPLVDKINQLLGKD